MAHCGSSAAKARGDLNGARRSARRRRRSTRQALAHTKGSPRAERLVRLVCPAATPPARPVVLLPYGHVVLLPCPPDQRAACASGRVVVFLVAAFPRFITPCAPSWKYVRRGTGHGAMDVKQETTEREKLPNLTRANDLPTPGDPCAKIRGPGIKSSKVVPGPDRDQTC